MSRSTMAALGAVTLLSALVVAPYGEVSERRVACRAGHA
jgi:hypothetical protein